MRQDENQTTATAAPPLPRRRVLATLAAGSAAALLPGSAAVRAQPRAAESFPSRPVRMVVAFAPGGNSDTLARLIQPRMAAALGQSIVIDNRGGAGGALAAGQVAGAPADGYTLLFDAASFVVAQFANRSVSFDYERDFAPVGTVAEVPYILAVSATGTIKDFKGFLDAAKAERTGLPYGSPGIDTVGHLAGALLAQRAGVKLEHVPYRGGAEVARDLAAGTLEAGILTTNSLRPVVDGGKARPIAVTSGKRGGIEGVPTIAESGLPGFDLTSWNAVLCRSGTPDPVRRRIEDAINAATSDPDVKARFAEIGAEATRADPGGLAERIVRERNLVRDLVRDTGISLG